MYSGKTPLAPGAPVCVEQVAQVVGLVDASNPHWYEVEYPDGRREVVSVARLTRYQERVRVALEESFGKPTGQ